MIDTMQKVILDAIERDLRRLQVGLARSDTATNVGVIHVLIDLDTKAKVRFNFQPGYFTLHAETLDDPQGLRVQVGPGSGTTNSEAIRGVVDYVRAALR